ncbi:MAG: EamA-like transporter family protein [Candidatus Dependentiae bacterium ADurb.Bin331]|nr:MAG: EamA-like transporter family protein [Candidatus Dependentiae bacterium ADurb.Bin331]
MGAFLFTIFIGNGVAYPLYAQLLQKYPATLVSLAGLLIPVFVTLLGMLLLGEQCSVQLVIGALCICVGMVMFTFNARVT